MVVVDNWCVAIVVDNWCVGHARMMLWEWKNLVGNRCVMDSVSKSGSDPEEELWSWRRAAERSSAIGQCFRDLRLVVGCEDLPDISQGRFFLMLKSWDRLSS